MSTILIVDDEPAIAMILERILSTKYNVITAVTVDEALKDHLFDIALVDVMMPKMTGPELVRELKKKRPSTKFLFMSGAVGVQLPRPCCIVEKPFSLTTITEAVDNIDAVLQGVKKIPGIIRLE